MDTGYQSFEGGYHAREGLVPAPAAPLANRSGAMYKPDSKWTWLFLLTAVVQAAIVIGFESYIFAANQVALNSNLPTIASTRTIPTYLVLFIFGFIYEIFLVYDSLRLKNTIQVIGLCCFNAAMLIYAAVQVDQINKAIYALARPDGALVPDIYIDRPDDLWNKIYPFIVAVSCVIAFGTVVMSYTAWKLYEEFSWVIYKHISADLRMKHRFLVYQIYIALLKFDFFFFLGFTVQFVVIVADSHDPEFWLTIAAIPITIIILLMAGLWVRQENGPGVLVVLVLYFAGLAYFIFKLVRMYQPGRAFLYLPVRKSLTVFAVLTIILIIMTIINAIMCMQNFNKGLKPFVVRRKIRSEEEKGDGMTELPDLKQTVHSRMTID